MEFCGDVPIDRVTPKWSGRSLGVGADNSSASYECFDLTEPAVRPAWFVDSLVIILASLLSQFAYWGTGKVSQVFTQFESSHDTRIPTLEED